MNIFKTRVNQIHFVPLNTTRKIPLQSKLTTICNEQVRYFAYNCYGEFTSLQNFTYIHFHEYVGVTETFAGNFCNLAFLVIDKFAINSTYHYFHKCKFEFQKPNCISKRKLYTSHTP